MSSAPTEATAEAAAGKDSQDVGAAHKEAAGGGGAFIAALDVGTTCVRCFILDERCVVRGSAVDAVSGPTDIISLNPRVQS